MARAVQPKQVIFYKDENGNVPVKKWLFGMKDRKARQRILKRLRYVELGNYGDHKTLSGQNELIELRFDFGPGYRLYFAEDKQTIVVLLAGGDKKSQKKDINSFAKRLADYKAHPRYEKLSDS